MRLAPRCGRIARRAGSAALLSVLVLGSSAIAAARVEAGQAGQSAAAADADVERALAQGVPIPPGYVIGTDDVLSIVFWREADMSSDVVVRPDGMISLPLLNDVTAAGLTPDALRAVLTERAAKFIDAPTVTVVVRAINSRKVFITGQVMRPNAYPLSAPLTVVQLITMAGGLQDWAKTKNIVILREVNGTSLTLPFNYNDILRGRNLQLNIELQPGDTVLVP